MSILKSKKAYLIALLAMVIVVIIFSGSFSGLSKGYYSRTYMHNGIMDLKDWDPAIGDIFNLNGQWEFYWQKLLTYDDFRAGNAKPDLTAEVPRVWNNYKINGNSLPGFGFATYRLKVKNAKPGQALAIRMPTVSASYYLYINDRLIASNGKVGADKEHFRPEYRPVTAEFTPTSGEFDIILQAANFSYARGGIWYPVIMGSHESMDKYDKAIGYKDLFLVGAFLIIALYYLCIFFMRREDRSSLYFVLLCLAAIGRTIIYGDYIINRILPRTGYPVIIAIDFLTTTWAPVTLVFLTGELFPEQTSTKLKKIFAVYAALISLFIVFFPIHAFTGLTIYIQAITLAMLGYAIICVLRAYPGNKTDSAIVMAGMLTAALGALHDVFFHNNIITSDFGEFSAFGFLIFLFLQAFMLARRFSEAYNDSKVLSEKLMKLNELKDEFLANTSHELRTPLNAIINIAEAISRGAEGAINEKQKAELAMIASSGKHLTNLINDILDYSKLRNFDLQMNLEAVNLKRAVESVMNVIGRLSKSEQVQMLIDIPDDLPDIYADENRLLQILYNLAGNALKFTEAGFIKVSAERTGDVVEVCVEDTGNGIPEDKLDIIFESYRQLEDSLTRKNGGTGLGLSITKYLVEAQGGKIRVESTVGVGSKFYFSIPVSDETAEVKVWPYEITEGEIAASRYSKSYIKFPYRHKGKGPYIMLVDDNEANLMSLAAVLELKDYSVTAVTSSDMFFKEFKAARDISLVILDVMLPGLSGYDICSEIRKNFSVSELPVLILTARTRSQDIVMGMEAGANDYLAKPFDTDELLARVKTLIRLKQSVDKALASELAFLQAQIKPHFLYNALNTFVAISLYDIEKARNLITELGNYLRRSFDFKGLSQLVPLKNELELVRAYLEIEKARFEERIEVVYDLTDDLEIKVPILVLQPIVENAVVHGILPKEEGGRIEICIRRSRNVLYFAVKDNGTGMEPKKESGVFEHEFGSGVGLSNIDNRLRKLYGRGLQIKSIPCIGTEVEWQVQI